MVSDSKDVYEFTRFESVRFLTALLLLGGAAYTFATGPLICALFLSTSSAVLLCSSCKLHFEAPRWGALDPLLLLILGGAIFFRAYALTEYPEGFSGHTTAQFQIRKVAIHELLPALPQGDWRTVRAALTHIIDEETGPVGIIEAIGFAFYGASADTTRIMPAVVGTLSVLLAYFLGLALHNRSTARIFALLLATCPWNIAFSRYDNLEHVMAPCHLLACLLALQTAAESGRKLLYFIAGVRFGLSFYVYASNRV
ncbi:MAG: glycosyltransferase family 39 protein, partial [Deltaproteobacteria bacterium]|nr:glycosyltransferase family 39 protein [Deltaproteobacteria bacterium]